MGKRVGVFIWAPLHGHSPAPRDTAGRRRGRLDLRRKMLCRYILNMQIRKGRTLETAKDPLPGHRRAEEGAGETGWQRTNPRGAGGQGPCANMAPSWPLPRPGSHLSAQLAGCLSLPPPRAVWANWGTSKPRFQASIYSVASLLTSHLDFWLYFQSGSDPTGETAVQRVKGPRPGVQVPK